MSLTVNAPTPYPPLAASARSCRMDTRGIAKFSFLCTFKEFGRRAHGAQTAGTAIVLMVAEGRNHSVCRSAHRGLHSERLAHPQFQRIKGPESHPPADTMQ